MHGGNEHAVHGNEHAVHGNVHGGGKQCVGTVGRRGGGGYGGAGSMRVHLRESSGNVDSVDSTEAESAAAESAAAVSMAESRG